MKKPRWTKALALSMLLAFSGTNCAPPSFAGDTESREQAKDKKSKKKKAKQAEKKSGFDTEFGKGFQPSGFDPAGGFQKDMNKAQAKKKKAKKKK